MAITADATSSGPCARGGERYQSFVDCMLNCTCDIDVREDDIVSYCQTARYSHPTSRSACLCVATRCQLKCINEVQCTRSEGFDNQCWILEDVMPCDIGCSPRPEWLEPSESRPPPLAWDFASTPCVSDIVSQIVTTTIAYMDGDESVTITRVGSQYMEAIIVGGIVAVILLCMCATAAWRLKRRLSKPQEGQPGEGQPDEQNPDEEQPEAQVQSEPDPARPNPFADCLDVDCNSLTVPKLKELIKKASLRSDDCIEKSDLIQRAEEAKAKIRAVYGPKDGDSSN